MYSELTPDQTNKHNQVCCCNQIGWDGTEPAPAIGWDRFEPVPTNPVTAISSCMLLQPDWLGWN